MPNERGRIHEHNALVSPCEKLLSVHVRDAFRTRTWSLSSGLCFHSHPFWIGGELPVFIVRPHTPNRDIGTVTVQYEYMYRATPNIYIYIYIYTDQNDKCNTFVFFPHFSWAELKDVRLFLSTQKAYFSQILFTNLSKSVLVSTSCRDNPSTSQVWHIKMLIRQNDYCTGGLGLQTWGKLSWNWTENELIPKVLF